jgi:hypothetical protein
LIDVEREFALKNNGWWFKGETCYSKDKHDLVGMLFGRVCVYQQLSEISYWISKFPYLRDKRLHRVQCAAQSVADLEDAMKIIPTLAQKKYTPFEQFVYKASIEALR